MKSREELMELVKLAKYGDSMAFSTLYDHYLTPIFRFVYFRVRSKEDAEDITQQVFLKAWNALGAYEQEGAAFSAWLYRIARNTTIDYWRKKKSLPIDPSSELFTKKADKNNNPAQLAQQREDGEIIKGALQILPEDQQTILTLKFIEGLSNTEIAEIMEKSEGAVRQAQSRGLKALRLHFQKHPLV